MPSLISHFWGHHWNTVICPRRSVPLEGKRFYPRCLLPYICGRRSIADCLGDVNLHLLCSEGAVAAGSSWHRLWEVWSHITNPREEPGVPPATSPVSLSPSLRLGHKTSAGHTSVPGRAFLEPHWSVLTSQHVAVFARWGEGWAQGILSSR